MLRSVGARVLFFGLLLCLPFVAQADFFSRDNGGSAYVSIERLPAEARDTLRMIRQHGPFAFPRDGVVFSNYEHRLPTRPRGYYHEYTVKTPGAHNRGARRIVCGPLHECYYSGDHYQTFQRIKE